MNLYKKKIYLGSNYKLLLEKKIRVFSSNTIKQKLKCALPVVTNKIKLYTFDGFICRTHLQGNNLNQTYSFSVTIAKSLATITIPAQSPLLKIYPLE